MEQTSKPTKKLILNRKRLFIVLVFQIIFHSHFGYALFSGFNLNLRWWKWVNCFLGQNQFFAALKCQLSQNLGHPHIINLVFNSQTFNCTLLQDFFFLQDGQPDREKLLVIFIQFKIIHQALIEYWAQIFIKWLT